MKKVSWNQIKMYPETAHTLKGADVIKNYCMGGRAIVTLSSPTKVHHTYFIRSPWKEDKGTFSEDVRFVSSLQANGKWLYVGQLCKDGTVFRKTRSSYFSEDTEVFKGMKYIVRMMNEDFETPMILRHEGCCSRCGRRLTDPESIERGMGKRCSSYADA